jgi:hypothetical protein
MKLQPFLAEVLGQRPDLTADSRRVTLLVQKAARRVIRETHLLTMPIVQTVVASQIATGPYGDCRFLPGPLTAGIAQGWDKDVNLEVLRWEGLSLRKNGDATVPPVILKAKSGLDYQDYLLLLARGGIADPGTPEIYSDRMGNLFLAPSWDLVARDQLVATAVVAPTADSEFMEIPDLPADSEDALLAMALSEVLDAQGRGRDPGRAVAQRSAALNLCGRLKGQNRIGQSGDLGGRMGSNPFNFRVR